MELILRSRKNRVRRKQSNPFSWYDPDTKQIVRQTGGRMELHYDPVLKKLKPRVIDEISYVYEDNFKYIKSWVGKRMMDFNISVIQERPGHWIVLDIDKNQLNDATEDLYRHGIVFDHE